MARQEALSELARTNAELTRRLAEGTVERDEIARDEAIIELARTRIELKQRLAERTVERDDLARRRSTELARTNAELKERLAERTIERDHVARDEALTELARTNAELEQRLAERTIERDDVARDEALTELARTNAELEQRLAERTIERDDVARDDALVELARTNAELKQGLAERTIEARPPALLRAADGNVTALRGGGLALGLQSIVGYGSETSRTTILSDLSLLALYTDGLIEATRDIEEGEQKVRRALQSAAVWDAENSAAAICDDVLEEVLDDVAILTIRIERA